MDYDIAIIGGGASGLAAAVSAHRSGAKNIAVFERLDRVGKKLLATGNGRCNIMHAAAQPTDYYGDAEFIRPALEMFEPMHEAFFRSLGIELRKEDSGCIYPKSNQAAAVLDCLRLTLEESGIPELTGKNVTALSPINGGFAVTADRKYTARRVIFAVGGLAAPTLGGSNSFISLLKPLGHMATDCRPGLTGFKLKQKTAFLKGQRVKCRALLLPGGASETGEVIFGDDGISGITIMQLSLKYKKGDRLLLVLREGDCRTLLKERIELFPKRTLENLLTGLLPKRVAIQLIKSTGIDALGKAASELTSNEIIAISNALGGWSFDIIGTGDYAAAQVMQGGLLTRQFNRASLESRLVKGLYACGEALDVTGPCGGYNLEWAWASGVLAGRRAAESL